jgi:outer membrane lipoprotein-sorting protein
MLASVFAACRTTTTFPAGIEKLLVRMKKKVDPQNKLKDINTKVVTGKLIRNSKDKNSTITLKIKRPDMIRFDIVVPGQFSLIKAYDGKEGWVYKTNSGISQLEVYPLNFLKYQADYLNPDKDFKKLFSKIQFVGKEKVAGYDCYKLLCIPKEKYGIKPITLYIDKDTALIRKRVSIQGNEKTGFFEIDTILDDYREVDGILVPFQIISKIKDNLMEYDVTSVTWNEILDDSVFTPPEKLK